MAADATVYQGSDNILALVVYTDSGQSTAKDLTGFDIVAYRVGRSLLGTTALEVTGTVNANGSIVEFGTRSAGEVNITLGKDDLADLLAMRYTHQIVLDDSSGNRQVVLTGYLTVEAALPSA